jgi:hypothetical protein
MRLLKKPPPNFETTASFALLVEASESTVKKRLMEGVLKRDQNSYLNREDSLRRWRAYIAMHPTRGRGRRLLGQKKQEIAFASPLAEKLSKAEIEQILDAAENAFSVAPISASEVWFSWRNHTLKSRAGKPTIVDVFDLDGSLRYGCIDENNL